VHFHAAEVPDLIRREEQSGAAVKVFCRDHGVSEPSCYSWRKRLGNL
jgi:transposase-like protein